MKPLVAALSLAACLAGCADPASAPPVPTEESMSPGLPPPPLVADEAPTTSSARDARVLPDETAFAGKVWKVKTSTALEPGTTFAFLADGTLVIDSAHATPMVGEWRYEDGQLVTVEEGISYPTDILVLDEQQFRIRSRNPGEPVETTLVPAPDMPLPSVPVQ